MMGSMQTRSLIPSLWLVAFLLLSACAGERRPRSDDGDGAVEAGPHRVDLGPFADGAAADGRTPRPEAPVCDQYVACTAAVTPAGLATVIAAYGEAGSCWGSLSAEACAEACAAGLVGLAALPGAGIPECARCNERIGCADSLLPACVDGECLACDRDAQCGGGACDLARHVCVECLSDAHCAGSAPACDVGTQRCVQCRSDMHCPATRPACDVARSLCAACGADADCPGSLPRCSFSGDEPRCVECLSGADCPSSAPRCASGGPFEPPATYTCGPCRNDLDCPGDEQCEPSGCRPTTCADLPASCGSHLVGGRTLECGTCTGGTTCTSTSAGHACRLPPGTSCNSNAPDSCGPDMRCVWAAPPNPASAGFCVVDVARTGCATFCSYQYGTPGLDGARVVGYCEAATSYCGPRCAMGATNCRASEICTTADRSGVGSPRYCLPL